MRLAPGLVVKRVEYGEAGWPFLNSEQEMVPGSAFTKSAAERKKSATSFSLPGFACSGTYNANFVISHSLCAGCFNPYVHRRIEEPQRATSAAHAFLPIGQI